MSKKDSLLAFIVIINWNGLQDTLECLESVFAMDYPDFKVIVVDNNSIDNSVKVIREKYPQVILIDNKKNLGFTGANNMAMRYAMSHNADYVWLLNNDTTVEVETLSRLVATGEEDEGVGLISAVIYYYDEPDRIQFCGSYMDMDTLKITNLHDLEPSKYERTEGQFWLWGTALLIKKSVVESIGYLDEEFFAYYEDNDYSVRSSQEGFKGAISPCASVYHKNPVTDSAVRSPHFYYYVTRNRYIFMSKHFRHIRRLSVLRNYISAVFASVGYLNKNNNDCVDACLEGMWAALSGVVGSWDKSIKMPRWLRRISCFFISWHPYFWSKLLRGEFVNIASEFLQRSRARILAIVA